MIMYFSYRLPLEGKLSAKLTDEVAYINTSSGLT